MRNLGLVALAVAFSLIWSSAYIVAKIGLTHFDPATLLTLRFALSALLLAPFARRGEARLGLVAGALNNALCIGLSFTALRLTRPVVVVAIGSCAPFLVGLLAAAFGIEKVRPTQFLGFALGLAGVAIITGFDFTGANLEGAGLAAGGILAFAIATLIIRSRAQGRSPTSFNFWQCIAGAGLLAPIALANGRGFEEVATASLFEPSVLALGYLVVVVTLIGMAMWLMLIRLVGAAGASACHLMNPFFGALLARAMLGTPLRAADFAGAASIAVGLALALDLAPRLWRSGKISDGAAGTG